MTEARYTLKIDPEFRRLVFPYSHEEYDKLEQKMIRVGCKEPVLVWYGHIIQAFEQYEICMAHKIPFKIKNINFRAREEAISIICREELLARQLPKNQRRYLIGKQYNADTIIEAHNAAGTDQFKERSRRDLFKGKKFYENSACKIRERIAGDYHVNVCSVIRYSAFAQAIDYIAAIRSEAANQILSGKMKITMETVMDCYGKNEDEVAQLLLMSGERKSMKKPSAAEKKIAKATTIKDMPVFDPDAEINSLALTIPSWISFINRTRTTANFSLLTLKGRNQLEQELEQLQETTEAMIYALKEVR